MKTVAGVLVALSLAGCATQQPASDAAYWFGMQRPFGPESPWLERPSVAQSGQIIPPSVVERNTLVTVRIACKVTAEGRMADCVGADAPGRSVELVAPAIEAARYVRMKTRMLDGRDVTGWTANFSMVFDVGGARDRIDRRIWPGTLQLTDPAGNPPRFDDGRSRAM
jgi:hypothetical protein